MNVLNIFNSKHYELLMFTKKNIQMPLKNIRDTNVLYYSINSIKTSEIMVVPLK